MEIKYRENGIIEIPATKNGIYCIGDLWNCRESTALGLNILLTTKYTKDNLRANPIKTCEYRMEHVTSAEDSLTILKIDGKLKIDILAGLLKLEGHVDYNSHEKENTFRETFICHYALEEWRLDLVPPISNDMLNRHVFDKINEKQATHVAAGLIIGAEIIGNIEIQTRQSDNHADVDCGGMVDIAKDLIKMLGGSITAEMKVKWQNEEKKKHSNVKVEVMARPMPTNTPPPQNVKELFDLVEKIPHTLTTEKHYRINDDYNDIYGVPIRVMLLPISHLIDLNITKLFKELEENFMENLKEMIVTCRDMQRVGYINKRILKLDNQLILLLSDVKSELFKEIASYEERLKSFGISYIGRSSKALMDYRHGTCSTEDLKLILDEYQDSEAGTKTILESIEKLFERGQTELNDAGLNARDKSPTGIKIFTNRSGFRRWISGEETIKVFLETNGGCSDGVFRKLHGINDALAVLDVEVAIIMPSVSDRNGLTVKVYEKKTRYEDMDINRSLDVISGIVSVGNATSQKFYKILASISGFALPLKKDKFKDFGDLVKLLLITKSNTYFAESRAALLNKIQNSDHDWVFCVPLDAHDTALDAVINWKAMSKDDKFKKVLWVFSCCEIFQIHEAPLLFAFYKGNICAVCLDKLDVLILNFKTKSQLDENTDLSILFPTEMKFSLYSGRAVFAIEFLKFVAPEQKYEDATVSMTSFDSVPDSSVNDIINVVRASFSQNYLEMMSSISRLVLKIYPNFKSVLAKYGWRESDCRFDEILFVKCDKQKFICDLDEWNKVHDEQNNTPGISNSDTIRMHISAIKTCLINTTDSDTNNVFVYIIKRYAEHLSNPETKREVENDLEEFKYYHIARLLAETQYDYRLAALHSELDKIEDIQKVEHLAKLFQSQSLQKLFGETNWIDMWKNSKIVFLITHATSTENENILVALNNLLKNVSNRHLIPQTIRDKLQHFNLGNVPVYDLASIDDVRRFFEEYESTSCDEVPESFRMHLSDSIRKHPELEEQLREANALTSWNTDQQVFTSPWRRETIIRALDGIRRRFYPMPPREDSVTDFNVIIPGPQLDPDSEDCSTLQVLTVRKCFKEALGDTIAKLTETEYLKLKEMVLKPSIPDDKLAHFQELIYSYVVQQIKMWDCYVVSAEHISSLVTKGMQKSTNYSKPTFSKTKQTQAFVSVRDMPSNSRISASRIDCIHVRLGSSDCFVQQYILRIMSKFPMALPLVMPDIQVDKYIINIPLLRDNVVKWESSPGNVVENYLFSSPYKMLVAVRLGNNKVGKSTILNQLMAKKYLFSSASESGSDYGKPVTLDGSVEFTWLTRETCDDAFWNSVVQKHYSSGAEDILLLANLHGDANNFSDTVRFLKQISSTFLTFIMPTCKENDFDAFLEIIEAGEHVPPYIKVDPTEYQDQDDELETAYLATDRMMEKVRLLLQNGLQCDSSKLPFDLDLGTSLQLCECIESDKSSEVASFVQKTSCRTIRDCIQQMENEKCSWQDNTILREFVLLFVRMFSLPMSQLKKAMCHVDKELSKISSKESLKARRDVVNLKEQLLCSIGSKLTKADEGKIRQKLNHARAQVDRINLGTEHLFRVLGRIYEITSGNSQKIDEVSGLPEHYANLLTNGNAIELLNGDDDFMPVDFLRSIFRSVLRTNPNLRVFVISIIGLQSSGKSTLLNALFSCNFAVSVGRCSRGLFMRLLFLDDELRQALRIDAILLIDSEGLGSPEKMNDKEADRRDRMMATFAMGISNLTLINVLGESMKGLTEILQIAILAMARLAEANIAPDILLVQHLQERNSLRTDEAKEQFFNSLQEACNIIEKENIKLGIQDVACLKHLFKRICSDQVLKQFRSFKDGSSAHAPPSKSYHEDVVNLYQEVLSMCKESTTNISFEQWFQLTESFWGCVNEEKFSLSFKSAKQVCDFIHFGTKQSKLKNLIGKTLRCHEEVLSQQMREDIDKETQPMLNDYLENKLKTMETHLKDIPYNCPEQCVLCKEVIQLTENLYFELNGSDFDREMKDSIKHHIRRIYHVTVKNLRQKCNATVLQLGCFSQFADIISKELKTELQQRPAGEFTDKERKDIVLRIWQYLQVIALSMNINLPLTEQIKCAIKNVYEQQPNAWSKVREGDMTFEKLQNTSAKSKTRFGFNILVLAKERLLNGEEVRYLQEKLEKCTEMVFANIQKGPLECGMNFNSGMIQELQLNVEDALEQFEKEFKKQLLPEFKWDVHIYALQLFIKRMTYLQQL